MSGTAGWWTEHWRTVVLCSVICFVMNIGTGLGVRAVACSGIDGQRDSQQLVWLRVEASVDPEQARLEADRFGLPQSGLPTQPAPPRPGLSRRQQAIQRATTIKFVHGILEDLERSSC